MHAYQFVEKFFPDWLQKFQPRNRQEKLAGLRESEADSPFDVSRVLYARGSAEVEVRDRDSGFGIRELGCQFDGDSASMRMSHNMYFRLPIPHSLFFQILNYPIHIIVVVPRFLRFRFIAKSGKIRYEEANIFSLQSFTKFREGLLGAAPAVQTEKNRCRHAESVANY